MVIYAAVNELLSSIENEFMFEQVGATTLNSNLNTEHTNGLTYSNIRDSLVIKIAGKTTVSDYADAIGYAISGLLATETTTTISNLNAGMVVGIADNDVATAVTALTTALNAIATPTAANIAAAIYDGNYIVSSGSYTTDIQTEISDYFNSDIFVTATSAIGTGDISSVAVGDGNTITKVIGNTALTGVTLLGTATAAALSLSAEIAALDTAVSTAIGAGALNTVGLRGATTAIPASLSVAVNDIDTVLGGGQLLENAAGAGTVSGVIGTISTGLLATPLMEYDASPSKLSAVSALALAFLVSVAVLFLSSPNTSKTLSTS